MARAQKTFQAQPRVQTGTPGLDQLLDGGLTANRMYLLQGLPGTGKTTIGLRYLIEGREQGERTLYVTLSETLDELTGVADSHGWTLDGVDIFQLPATEMQADQQYTIYHPAEIELGETVRGVLEAIERIKPRRVVFDSLSELRLLAREPLRFRRQILALKDFFAGRDMTVLLLDDQTSGPSGDQQIESLAHGVLLLEQLPFEYGRARRRVRVVKFRGVAAMEGFHDFVIRRGGTVVFPQIITRPSQSSRIMDAPLTSGVGELDQLVGGGLTWGTSTVLIGPAGAGKSTLAAQYIYAEGTRSAAFLFDERRASFIARADALGMHMSEHIEAGTV